MSDDMLLLLPEPSDGAKNRAKRSSTTKNTCPLLLVADYRFVKNMGQGKVSRTAIYLVWDSYLLGMGQLSTLLISQSEMCRKSHN